MGMFDTVMVPCPACGAREAWQSKSGDCRLDTYSLEDAPDDVLEGVIGDGPTRCLKCGVLFGVVIEGVPRPRRTLNVRSIVWEVK